MEQPPHGELFFLGTLWPAGPSQKARGTITEAGAYSRRN